MGGVVIMPTEWEQRRYEIARDIMAAIFVTYDYRGDKFSEMAYDAVRAADALIEELKGGNTYENNDSKASEGAD